ncbi:hypothetical protein ACSSS7_007006 [Eimeria intestinalis]
MEAPLPLSFKKKKEFLYLHYIPGLTSTAAASAAPNADAAAPVAAAPVAAAPVAAPVAAVAGRKQRLLHTRILQQQHQQLLGVIRRQQQQGRQQPVAPQHPLQQHYCSKIIGDISVFEAQVFLGGESSPPFIR